MDVASFSECLIHPTYLPETEEEARKATSREATRTKTSCNGPPLRNANRIKMIRVMEQAYKKRPHRATANSPPVLADIEEITL